MARSLDLLQGTLDPLVLKALSWGPRHGYAIATWLRETTGDRITIEDGALYTSLHRMEHRGWLDASWGVTENNRKAKYYTLTARGRAELAAAHGRWAQYAEAVSLVMEAKR